MSAGRLVILRGEDSAEERLHTQPGKEISRDQLPGDALRLAALAEMERQPVVSEDFRKDLVSLAQVVKRGIGKRILSLPRARYARQGDKLFGVFDRQRFEQHSVNQAKDSGVRSNAERERENGDGGEAGFLQQHSRAVAQVLKQCLHEISWKRLQTLDKIHS